MSWARFSITLLSSLCLSSLQIQPQGPKFDWRWTVQWAVHCVRHAEEREWSCRHDASGHQPSRSGVRSRMAAVQDRNGGNDGIHRWTSGSGRGRYQLRVSGIHARVSLIHCPVSHEDVLAVLSGTLVGHQKAHGMRGKHATEGQGLGDQLGWCDHRIRPSSRPDQLHDWYRTGEHDEFVYM